jgi:hypothetical protein
MGDPAIMQGDLRREQAGTKPLPELSFFAEQGKLREKFHFMPSGAAILLFRSTC